MMLSSEVAPKISGIYKTISGKIEGNKKAKRAAIEEGDHYASFGT